MYLHIYVYIYIYAYTYIYIEMYNDMLFCPWWAPPPQTPNKSASGLPNKH